MNKRFTSALIAITLIVTCSVSAINIPENAWYSEYLNYVLERNLVEIADSEFVENQYVSKLDIIKTAAKLSGDKNISNYSEYAINKGYINSENELEINATRGFAADIFSKLLIDSELINNVTFIPDVSKLSDTYADIVKLYNAGIITGKDADGYFYPSDFITVEELAAIAARISNKDMRLPVALSSGINLNSILEQYKSCMVEDDFVEFKKFSNDYTITQSMLDLVTYSVKDTASDEEKNDILKTYAVVTELMNKYDFAISEDAFATLKSDYDALHFQIKNLIEDGTLPFTEYAYLENFWINSLYEQFYFEYIINKMPSYDTVYDLYSDEYVLAKHILITFEDDTAEAKATALEKANEIYVLASEPESDFDLLIAEYGQDPGTAYYPNGYLFTYGEMVESFENAAFLLEEGAISTPVESEFGYHIIKKYPVTKEIFLANQEVCYNLSLAHIMKQFDSEFVELLIKIS